MVLVCLSGVQPDTRHVGRSTSATTRPVALRDGRSKFSTNSARGWCARIRTGSAAGPARTLKSMKPGSAAGRAAKAVVSTIRFLSPSAVEVRQRKPGTKLDKRKGGRYAGRVRLAIVPDRSAESLCGFVECAVVPGTSLVTDDWSGYASLAKRGYKHLAIAERGDPQVAEEYLPIIHLVFANLKTWLNGTHHGVSHQHLQAYLNEFTFRFNRRFYPFNASRSLLGIAGNITAPTYAELYSGA